MDGDEIAPAPASGIYSSELQAAVDEHASSKLEGDLTTPDGTQAKFVGIDVVPGIEFERDTGHFEAPAVAYLEIHKQPVSRRARIDYGRRPDGGVEIFRILLAS